MLFEKYYYIVDFSYFVFYVGNIVFSSYADETGLAKSEMGPDFDPTSDTEYGYMFMDAMKRILTGLVQKYDLFPDTSRFILCRDCKRSNLWRRDIYPDYKMNRDTKDHSKDRFNIGKIFSYAYEHILPALESEFNCISMMCGCAEADDIIAVMTKHILDADKANSVIIITSDRDMVQLCGDRVKLITAKGEERTPKEDLEKMSKSVLAESYDAKDFLLFKILIGDSSDNIPNVKYHLGPKHALAYLHDRQKLIELLKEDRIIAESFKRNKALISMDEIPEDIHKMIIDDYNEKINRQQTVVFG